jgi:hypothetical protein
VKQSLKENGYFVEKNNAWTKIVSDAVESFKNIE